MADTKITDLTSITGANTATGDVFPLVDVSDTTMAASGTNKKITRAELLASLATEMGVAQGDVVIGTGTGVLDNLTMGTTAGQALVADPNATNKVSVQYPLGISNSSAVCMGSTRLAASYDRAMVTETNVAMLSTGRITAVRIALPKGITVTSITFFSATTAAGTPTNQWFGLFDSSHNKLALTADDTTTAWAANTAKTLNLTSAYTTTYAGLYYVGIMVKATTVPTLFGGPSSGTVLIRSGASGQFTCYSADTGLTNPASCPSALSGQNTLGSMVYCEVS